MRFGKICLPLIFAASALIPQAVSAAETNLVLGKEYKIEFGAETANSYGLYTENGAVFDVDDGCLTDGIKKTGGSASGYYRAMRGQNRSVCFDLGQNMAVTGFAASFWHSAGSGIYAPRSVKMYLSEDGENYMLVAVAENDLPLSDRTPGKREYSSALEKAYSARYVKLQYDTDVFSYADEVEVFGGADNPAAGKIVPDALPADPGVYEKYRDEMKNAGDIIKIYDGYYVNQAHADNTEEELLPYIAYISKEGKITDSLFDSVAFVPCHTAYPSGGTFEIKPGSPGAVMSDWQLYADKTFGENINLAALDSAAAARNSALGTDEKIKVFLTIPYPQKQDIPFGDINGDGTAVYTRTLAERMAVVKWYVSSVTERFDGAGYKNLRLCGFYWFRETIGRSDSDHEPEFISEMTAYIKSLDYAILFDPCFISAGFDEWRQLGFSGAVMQPNLVFRDYFKTEMLEEFAGILKKYELGVEIETNEPSSFGTQADIEKNGMIYENYLYYGWKYGYMDSLHTFYQGAGPGSLYLFAKSSNPYLRYLYDITYKFIKRTYTMEPVVIETGDFNAVRDSVKNEIPFSYITDSNRSKTVIKFEAEHGKITALAGNARIFYTPDEGFTGTDTITVTATDPFGQITVKKINASVSGASAETSDGVSAAEKTDSKKMFLIAASVCAVAAAAIFASVIFIRRKIWKRKK